MSDTSGENKSGAADIAASQHVMVCALQELGSLVQSLNATAAPLIQEASVGEIPFPPDLLTPSLCLVSFRLSTQVIPLMTAYEH